MDLMFLESRCKNTTFISIFALLNPDEMKFKLFLLTIVLLVTAQGFAQIPTDSDLSKYIVLGKYGTYYDQRVLLFESMPTSTSDIIFLGNSITDGAEWSEIFQNPNCKNRGISGDIIPGVLNRLRTVTEGQPAMVFLMIGTNDMAQGADNDSIARGVRTIVQRIKAESPNTHIVVQSILPVNDCYGMYSSHTKRWQDVAVINKMLRTVAIEEGVDYLDLYHDFIIDEEGKLDPHYSNDGLHLNGNGYALWKKIIEETYGTFPRPVYQSSKMPVWLNSGMGLNAVRFYDQGASPLHYWGIGANIHAGVSVAFDESLVSYNLRGLGNIAWSDATSQAYDFGIELGIEYLYRFYDADHLHLWVGGAINEDFAINYSPQLMNAALGQSFFFHLNADGMVQYDFANHHGAHNWCTAYAKISLPVLGVAGRPGFAYIDNYTESLVSSENNPNNRETLSIPFPGVGTDIGLYLNLLNNNKIGFSYRWDYLTTRHQGTYRFDHATHSLNLTYMFNVN